MPPASKEEPRRPRAGRLRKQTGAGPEATLGITVSGRVGAAWARDGTSLSRAGGPASLRSSPYLRCQVVARGEVLEAVQAVPVPGSPSARVMVDHLGEAERAQPVACRAGGTRTPFPAPSLRGPRANTLVRRASSYLKCSHKQTYSGCGAQTDTSAHRWFPVLSWSSCLVLAFTRAVRLPEVEMYRNNNYF